MLSRMKPSLHWSNLALAALCWGGLILLVCGLAGCAVGRNDLNGDIVVGFKLGRLVETANQAVATGTEGLLGMLGVAAGPAGLVGLVAARFFAEAKSEKAMREGLDKGWESRERAAAVQLPLPPAASPSPAPVIAST